jgi:hypothetical protein
MMATCTLTSVMPQGFCPAITAGSICTAHSTVYLKQLPLGTYGKARHVHLYSTLKFLSGYYAEVCSEKRRI